MPIPPVLQIVDADNPERILHEIGMPRDGDAKFVIGRNELIEWLGPFEKSERVSRSHLEISVSDCQYGCLGNLTIEDLKSTNGSVPNIVEINQIPSFSAGEKYPSGIEVHLADVVSIRFRFKQSMMIDIGHFGTHDEAPGIDYLQSTLPSDIQSATALIESLGASLGSGYIHADEELLNSQERISLISHTESHFDGSPDFKLDLSNTTLIELIGQNRFEELSQRMEHDFSKIILRRVEDHGNAINFHTDYAKRTMQIMLSDETDYSGCDLVFATGQGFQQPRRKAGTATIHDYTVLHGVTEMKSGVRYSLFFLRNDPQFQRVAI